jgi:6-phosphofructokinase
LAFAIVGRRCGWLAGCAAMCGGIGCSVTLREMEHADEARFAWQI